MSVIFSPPFALSLWFDRSTRSRLTMIGIVTPFALIGIVTPFALSRERVERSKGYWQGDD